ncbi:armadillo-type protein [Baffinella frigidus]|nr:armadillo-type protein [Cryptophyta sp. CCMP2293]
MAESGAGAHHGGGGERSTGGGTLQLRGGDATFGFAQDLAAQVERTIRAVATMHDPHAGQAQRREAYEVCEIAKRDDEGCFLISQRLLDPSLPDPVRHFAFQLRAHLVEQRWEALPPTAKASLRQEALFALANGTRPLMAEARFVKEKVVQVVVGIARREWPEEWTDLLPALRELSQMGDTQSVNASEAELEVGGWGEWPEEWTDLLPALRELSQMGDTQGELALLLIRALPEDFINSPSISVRRRQVLLASLTAALPDLIDLTSSLLVLLASLTAALPDLLDLTSSLLVGAMRS